MGVPAGDLLSTLRVADPKEVAGYLKARLNRAYDLFFQTAPGNSYPMFDN